MRRAWDYPIPNGESLKQVYERVVPFYLEKIVPLVNAGKNVLVVSHGNALRALTKYIESVSDSDFEHLEIPFGSITIYDLDSQGRKLNKEVRSVESTVNA
jgi:2,3-bisphosphoglycerate-dependent phosphoglycerate mutase